MREGLLFLAAVLCAGPATAALAEKLTTLSDDVRRSFVFDEARVVLSRSRRASTLPGFGDQLEVELLVEAGFSPGEEVRRAIASVIVAGQTLALVLTLVGTPVACSLFDDCSARRHLGSFLGRIMTMRPA